MSNDFHVDFHVAIVAEKHFVPEQSKNSFSRYVDALRWVVLVAQDNASDLTPVIANLGTVTGDGSKGIGATEMATIVNEWQLSDGRYIHIYQIR
jgi:hypothetical protein